MARLRRCAHRVVWLNPLAADPRYEPLTRGMQAALPHVDHLLAGQLDRVARGAGRADGGGRARVTRPPRAAEAEPEIGGIVLAAGEGGASAGPSSSPSSTGGRCSSTRSRRCSRCPRLDRVVVVLGAHADARSARRSTCAAPTSSSASDWADGQSASLRAGVARARRGRGGRRHARRPAVHHARGDRGRARPPRPPPRGARDLRRRARPPGRCSSGGCSTTSRRARRRRRRARAARRRARAPWECGRLCDPTDIDTPERLQEVQS